MKVGDSLANGANFGCGACPSAVSSWPSRPANLRTYGQLIDYGMTQDRRLLGSQSFAENGASC